MDNNLLLDVKHQGFVNWDVDVKLYFNVYGKVDTGGMIEL